MLCLERLHANMGLANALVGGDLPSKWVAACKVPRPASRTGGPKATDGQRTFRNSTPRRLTVKAARQNGGSYSDPQKHERRTLLLKYVQDVQPQVMEQFAEQSPPQVVGAMRQTITNLLGTLPPQFFTVRVHTVGENLAQLMYSVMMTGYMFRNTQYRMELKNTLGTLPPTPAAPAQQSGSSSQLPAPVNPADLATATASITSLATTTSSETRLLASTSSIDLADIRSSMDAPSTSYSSRSRGGGSGSISSVSSVSSSGTMDSVSIDEEEYAPGVQKTRVQGEVLRWHYKNGLEELPAVEYMEMLEAEVASLRQQLATLAAAPPRPAPQFMDENRNDLLDYLKTLDSHSLQELTAGAGDEVAEAMNTFIHRMLGTEDKEQLRAAASDCTANELAKLLFWLMVVGYSLRTLEVRFDMERSLDIHPNDFNGNKGLPPGR